MSYHGDQNHQYQTLIEPTDEFLAQIFQKVDKDRSGAITANELEEALSNGSWTTFNPETVRMMIGYRLSDRFVDLLIKKFDRSACGTVAFDDFIQACVSIQTLTNSFQSYDRQRNGSITIGYEEFLTLVFTLNM
ncbi:unnamed protein product [Didymodactylos carnosus]|uniref:EF-hand domain-containing protein n=1 Tax=Didymodactylos carnosus TaxID=1234261 RepID=A0A813YH32_9BILA|nr:unnamed protein product [Didymodactylos carnosus]CAF3669737.1 unnamed protein product [Didymodactylos carnosus]